MVWFLWPWEPLWGVGCIHSSSVHPNVGSGLFSGIRFGMVMGTSSVFALRLFPISVASVEYVLAWLWSAGRRVYSLFVFIQSSVVRFSVVMGTSSVFALRLFHVSAASVESILQWLESAGHRVYSLFVCSSRFRRISLESALMWSSHHLVCSLFPSLFKPGRLLCNSSGVVRLHKWVRWGSWCCTLHGLGSHF